MACSDVKKIRFPFNITFLSLYVTCSPNSLAWLTRSRNSYAWIVRLTTTHHGKSFRNKPRLFMDKSVLYNMSVLATYRPMLQEVLIPLCFSFLFGYNQNFLSLYITLALPLPSSHKQTLLTTPQNIRKPTRCPIPSLSAWPAIITTPYASLLNTWIKELHCMVTTTSCSNDSTM